MSVELSPSSVRPFSTLIDAETLEALTNFFVRQHFEKGSTIVREGDDGTTMFFLVRGAVSLDRRGLSLTELHAGECFGELALLTRQPRAATVTALEPTESLELSIQSFERFGEKHPTLALRFLRSLISRLGEQLTQMTDSVGLLLKERTLPRRATVEVVTDERTSYVRTGTSYASLLPREVGGAAVVAALVGNKAQPLITPVTSEVTLQPLTANHLEGSRVVRRSMSLLVLEAVTRVFSECRSHIGPSLGLAERVIVEGLPCKLEEACERINHEMQKMIESDVPFREELWTTDEAIHHFESEGLHEAALLLRTWRLSTVPLVSCGHVHALGLQPLVPSASYCKGARLDVRDHHLVLHLGEPGPFELQSNGHHVVEIEGPSSPAQLTMLREHEKWLHSLGIESVGAFNSSCIQGHVSALIRVAEGFHEKQIGRIADVLSAHAGKLRIVTIAGPSSSGKTTFIKRLSVQLQVNGITPKNISLDDYYVDRDRTPRDSEGEYDFEALEALDLALLGTHLTQLVQGDCVRTAKYDFRSGKSNPNGGPEFQLGKHDILMLEGIHGLNPKLLPDTLKRDQVFRIFIQPMMSPALDHLSRVHPSDVRLIRRIVRDRHQRGYSAADNIMRWPSVRKGERSHIYPFMPLADAVFDTSVVYELAVLKVFAERYLLEVPTDHPAHVTAFRLRQLIDRFVAIYPDHVPPTSILREFIGGSTFEY